jgi:hypothetical protein
MRIHPGRASGVAPRRAIGAKLIAFLTATLVIAPMFVRGASPATAAGTFVTGTYGRDSSSSGFQKIHDTGFNTVMMSVNLGNIASSLKELAALQAKGMRAVIWLGSYDRAVHCAFERSDSWIRQVVSALGNQPAIAAYQVGDEVDRARARGCTNIRDQIAHRSSVIRSVNPAAQTYVTITADDGTEAFPYERFAGTTTIMGLVIYPCVKSSTACNWDRISKAISQADADGVGSYWVVMQDFGNTVYRQPTATQLAEQMKCWHSARLSGYFLYHWDLGKLEQKPSHLQVLRNQNTYFRSR